MCDETNLHQSVEMRRTEVCRDICEAAYEIGYTAKLYYSAYDILTRGLLFYIFINVGLCSYMIGLGRSDDLFPYLMFIVTASALILSRLYDMTCNQDAYYEAAIKHNKILDELHSMLLEAKNTSDEAMLEVFRDEVYEAKKMSNAVQRPRLFWGCGWVAHYKFFSDSDNDWIKEFKNFSFFCEVMPASFLIFVSGTLAGLLLALL